MRNGCLIFTRAHRSCSVIQRLKLPELSANLTNLYVLSRKRRTHREHVRRSLNLCRLLDRRGVQLKFHSSHPIDRPACRNGYSLYLITGLRRIGLSPVDHVAAYQPARILPSYRFLRKVV